MIFELRNRELAARTQASRHSRDSAPKAHVTNDRLAAAAALEACRLRLRPIVMTSVAFIAGTVPLVLSHGAGAEVRSATGITVFAGMIGVTLFGLFLTPVFYVGLRTLSGGKLVQHGEGSLAHG